MGRFVELKCVYGVSFSFFVKIQIYLNLNIQIRQTFTGTLKTATTLIA